MPQIETIKLVLALRKVRRMIYVSAKMERIAEAIEEELEKRATQAMLQVYAK